MYKNLFNLVYNLIVYPGKTWVQLSEDQNKDNEIFYKSYLNPILGFIALFSFVGVCISLGKIDFQFALKAVLKQTLTYFVAFYCTSWGLSAILRSYFYFPVERFVLERFVGYSSIVVYLTAMFSALFPSLFFLQIFSIYTLYLVWQGAVFYFKLNEDIWVKFTIFAGVLILIFPLLVGFIISLIMPGLK